MRHALPCSQQGCRNSHDLGRLSADSFGRTRSTLHLHRLAALPPKISASKIIGIQRAARDDELHHGGATRFLIRPVLPQMSHAGYRRVHEHAFNSGPRSPARVARALRQFELARSLAAFDETLPAAESVVGTTGIYSLRHGRARRRYCRWQASPHGLVLPSHRRRGVLRSLMHRQLADVAARGEEPSSQAVGVGDADLQPVGLRVRVVARAFRVPGAARAHLAGTGAVDRPCAAAAARR